MWDSRWKCRYVVVIGCVETVDEACFRRSWRIINLHSDCGLSCREVGVGVYDAEFFTSRCW